MQVLAWIGILHSIFYFNSSVIRALGKPAWVLGIGGLNATVNFIAFLLVVRWGIVAVATAYVIRGYLFSPVPLLAIRRLIQLDFRMFLRQFIPPLAGCLFMVAVILGCKHFLENAVSVYWQLGLYIVAGGAAYLLTLQLIAPALLRQISSLVNSILPRPKLRRV
jgi:PST family polysaccharide transporter